MDSIGVKYNVTAAAAGTKVVVSKQPGVLFLVTINKASAQALTLYDDKTATAPANAFASLKALVAEGTYMYRVSLNRGLVIDAPASYTGDATVSVSPGI